MTRAEVEAQLPGAVARMRAVQREYEQASRRNCYCGDVLDRRRAAEERVDQLLAQLGDKGAAGALQVSLFGGGR